jgi:hypothetical protein
MASAQAMGGEVIGGAFENSTKLSIIHSYLRPNVTIFQRQSRFLWVDELLLISGWGLLEALSGGQRSERSKNKDE